MQLFYQWLKSGSVSEFVDLLIFFFYRTVVEINSGSWDIAFKCKSKQTLEKEIIKE